MVRHDRPDLVGVRVLEAVRRKLPGAGERRKCEHRTSGADILGVLTEPRADEAMDQNRIPLPMAIDPTVGLLHPVGVPGNPRTSEYRVTRTRRQGGHFQLPMHW